MRQITFSDKIGKAELRQRFESLALQPYVEWLNITKSITWLIAATGILAVWFAFNNEIRLERLVYLTATYLIAQIPVATYARGLLLHSQRYNPGDEMFPGFMALLMVLLFLSQILNTPVAVQLGVPEAAMLGLQSNAAWFWLVAAHAFTAFLLVSNRIWLLVDSDFESNLQPLIDEYRGQIKGDAVGAFAFSAAAFATAYYFDRLASVPLQGEIARYIPNLATLAAASFGAGALFVVFRASFGRERLRAMLRRD